MDNYDWKILAALQSDGRLTNQEIGNRIGLSASQCSRRRTALEQAGVISGYGARLNSRAIGASTCSPSFTCTCTRTTRSRYKLFSIWSH